MDEHRDICVNGHVDPPRHPISRACRLCQRERARVRRQQLTTAQRSAYTQSYRVKLRDEIRAAYQPVECSLCGSTFQCSLEYTGTEPLPRKDIYAAARVLGFPPQFRWVCSTCLSRRAVDTRSNPVIGSSLSGATATAPDNNNDEMNRPGSMCINGHLDPPRHKTSRSCRICQRERVKARAKERRRQDGAARIKAYRARARQQGIEAYGGVCCNCGTRDTEVLQMVLLDPSVTLHSMIWVAARQMGYPDIFALVCPTCRYRAKYLPGELTPGQTS